MYFPNVISLCMIRVNARSVSGFVHGFGSVVLLGDFDVALYVLYY